MHDRPSSSGTGIYINIIFNPCPIGSTWTKGLSNNALVDFKNRMLKTFILTSQDIESHVTSKCDKLLDLVLVHKIITKAKMHMNSAAYFFPNAFPLILYSLWPVLSFAADLNPCLQN